MTHPENLKRFHDIFKFPMPIDGTMTVVSEKTVIDILKFDELLGERIEGYDPNKCAYKGKKNYSCEKIVEEVYGEEAVKFIRSLI